ncbi:hypothetical protein V8F33_011214, partial [Rhypophila sp. PSN 637]
MEKPVNHQGADMTNGKATHHRTFKTTFETSCHNTCENTRESTHENSDNTDNPGTDGLHDKKAEDRNKVDDQGNDNNKHHNHYLNNQHKNHLSRYHNNCVRNRDCYYNYHYKSKKKLNHNHHYKHHYDGYNHTHGHNDIYQPNNNHDSDLDAKGWGVALGKWSGSNIGLKIRAQASIIQKSGGLVLDMFDRSSPTQRRAAPAAQPPQPVSESLTVLGYVLADSNVLRCF